MSYFLLLNIILCSFSTLGDASKKKSIKKNRRKNISFILRERFYSVALIGFVDITLIKVVYVQMVDLNLFNYLVKYCVMKRLSIILIDHNQNFRFFRSVFLSFKIAPR